MARLRAANERLREEMRRAAGQRKEAKTEAEMLRESVGLLADRVQATEAALLARTEAAVEAKVLSSIPEAQRGIARLALRGLRSERQDLAVTADADPDGLAVTTLDALAPLLAGTAPSTSTQAPAGSPTPPRKPPVQSAAPQLEIDVRSATPEQIKAILGRK